MYEFLLSPFLHTFQLYFVFTSKKAVISVLCTYQVFLPLFKADRSFTDIYFTKQHIIDEF